MAALSSLSYVPSPLPSSSIAAVATSTPTPSPSPSSLLPSLSDVHLHLSAHSSLSLSSLPPVTSITELKSEEKPVDDRCTVPLPHRPITTNHGDDSDEPPPLLRASSIIAGLTHEIADYRETLTCSVHQRPLRDLTLTARAATARLEVTKSSSSASTVISQASSNTGTNRLKCRRTMRHHFGKITCAVWACDSRQILSTSTDQTVAFSDALTAKRLCRYPTRANWTMSCAWSPTMHTIAMTNTAHTVLVCRVPTNGATTAASNPTVIKLDEQYELYDQWSRSVRWITDTQLITGNGDGTLTIWDVPTATMTAQPHIPLAVLHGHTADVYHVRPSPTDSASIVASCSSDHSVAIWDLRISGNGARVQQLLGHESDVKALNWLRNGQTLVSGGSDSTCRMWDIRCVSQVQSFHSPKLVRQCVSLDISLSGRTLFTSYDPQPWPCPPTGQQIAPSLITWDTLTGEMLDQYVAHENKIEDVQVSPDGSALLTASWDTAIKIWTY